ncbi:NAD-dependent epimerase/dehydratase family protein [Flavobacterium sp. 5]|uniref:NAD-dependent epimerase/dehydratase family protein n=1 Tax=Flavobacterium sp. 5 TaxID=2035199 RepID=UPI000C2CDDA2|nr:NAD-dependent epimerase/dehydratase family protein [Flavobacterium sp. 5]PKB17462.1 nucleoside-diphosphate-sugar epimerase [Flavobacterium sp. 5]
MRIVITGEKGFLGIHLTNYLRHILKYEVVELGRNFIEVLPNTKEIDWLIHGACVHRHNNPEMVLHLNNEITNQTIECLKKNNINCNVAFLSSIHEDAETFYGKSKREAKKQFENFCLERNTNFVSYKLPNVFGQYAKPNKTSFIATFSYNLLNNLPVECNSNLVKLAFVTDVVEMVCKFEEQEIISRAITVEEVYLLLIEYNKLFNNSIFPTFRDKFEFDLYQTFISYKNYKI